MSKYILDIDKYWEHTSNCSLCSAIDNQYKYIQELASQKVINKYAIQHEMKILEKMLVNGYGLINVYEANHTQHKLISDRIHSMSSYNDDIVKSVIKKYGIEVGDLVYNTYISKEPTLIFSRFCKDCGARKPDIFDTECLKDFKKLTFISELINATNPKDDKHPKSILLKWLPIDYDFKHCIKIFKKSDTDIVGEKTDSEGYTLLFTTDDDRILQFEDNNIEDGRAYYYKLEYVNEFDFEFYVLKTNVLNPADKDHTPKNVLNFSIKKHRKLIRNADLTYSTYDTVFAYYEVDNDDNFGDVFIKLNEEHVPSIDYWYKDLEFKNHDVFEVTKDIKEKRYFLKPYVRSRVFKKDGIKDHDKYPDLYYWNTNMPAQFFNYSDFKDEMYGLTFTEGKRSMKITYHLKINNAVDHVRIMFKQDNKYITDDDDGTYKIVDVPAVHALYDYEVDITGLASNTFWVFGVFPVYKGCDPDIRIEYQYITKIKPWFQSDMVYDSPLEFYYVGRWYYDYDFDKYDLPGYDKIKRVSARNKKVMMCDRLSMKDVSVLLIHNDDCAEHFRVGFDFKMIAKTRQDRMHYFLDGIPQLKVVDTYDQWMHFERDYYNYEYMILRWEQMKMSDSPWTCTFVDNVTVHNDIIIDTATDNFTRKDELKFVEYHYYNHTIKHNALYQHTPKKFYGVNIVINPYYDSSLFDKDKNGIRDDKELITVGVPDDNFTWMP